jgi:hypothetical protein
MFIMILALLCSTLATADEVWTPPNNPDPTVILREASNDTQSGKFDLALAKYVWFHENALKFDKAQHGVRLSFALSYWHTLGRRYSPALDKLKQTRDAAGQKVKDLREKELDDLFLLFSDFSAINRELGDESKTFELFKELTVANPEKAKRLFPLAKPAILKAKAYDLFLAYVDAEKYFDETVRNYDMSKQFGRRILLPGEKLSFEDQRFANDSATLVAILTKSGKVEDAQRLAVTAKGKLDDVDFHQSLADALEGVVPDPWP